MMPELTTIIYLLVGFSLGMILTAFAYHKWFVEYNETISDLKTRLKDKNVIIKSLNNHYEQPKDDNTK
jgi:hypothetical protein